MHTTMVSPRTTKILAVLGMVATAMAQESPELPEEHASLRACEMATDTGDVENRCLREAIRQEQRQRKEEAVLSPSISDQVQIVMKQALSEFYKHDHQRTRQMDYQKTRETTSAQEEVILMVFLVAMAVIYAISQLLVQPIVRAMKPNNTGFEDDNDDDDEESDRHGNLERETEHSRPWNHSSHHSGSHRYDHSHSEENDESSTSSFLSESTTTATLCHRRPRRIPVDPDAAVLVVPIVEAIPIQDGAIHAYDHHHHEQ